MFIKRLKSKLEYIDRLPPHIARLVVVFFSLLYLFIFYVIEGYAGIYYGVHPDSLIYIDSEYVNAACTAFNIRKPYECVANIFPGSVFWLLFLNVCFWVFTNVALLEIVIKKDFKLKIVLVVIMFEPFRAHWVLHNLKETLIIAFVVVSFVSKRSSLILFFACVFRPALGLLAFIRYQDLRARLFFSILFALGVWFYLPSFLILAGTNDPLFTLNAADSIPNFSSLSYLGSVVRFFVWPLIYASSLYVFGISSILVFAYVPLSALVLLVIMRYAKVQEVLVFFFVIGIIAVLAPWFTTYIRYVHAVSIAFVLMAIIDPVNLTKREKKCN